MVSQLSDCRIKDGQERTRERFTSINRRGGGGRKTPTHATLVQHWRVKEYEGMPPVGMYVKTFENVLSVFERWMFQDLLSLGATIVYPTAYCICSTAWHSSLRWELHV